MLGFTQTNRWLTQDSKRSVLLDCWAAHCAGRVQAAPCASPDLSHTSVLSSYHSWTRGPSPPAADSQASWLPLLTHVILLREDASHHRSHVPTATKLAMREASQEATALFPGPYWATCSSADAIHTSHDALMPISDNHPSSNLRQSSIFQQQNKMASIVWGHLLSLPVQ